MWSRDHSAHELKAKPDAGGHVEKSGKTQEKPIPDFHADGQPEEHQQGESGCCEGADRRYPETCEQPDRAQDLQDSGFALGGRRVNASVLFCDIRGFTALSENQPPEDTIELLNIYYTLMFEAVDCNGGIVTLMIGDGLMVLFGAPQPLDDPAQSAVSAARDMLAMMAEFNLERVAGGKAEIRIGIGIATGEVVAGYAGTQERATYTCIGDKVNLAARLEAHTKVVGCDILMDETTRRALGDQAGLHPFGQVLFKGFSNPQDVHAIGADIGA